MTSTGAFAAPGLALVLPSWLPVAGRLDRGSSDCGSGLLLAVTRAMRGVPVDEVLVVTTVERSVLEDLPAWAHLAGHTIVALAGSGARGPWEVAVRRGASPASHAGTGNAGAGSPDAAAPLGTRLWLYTNFDCNLACDYCCVGSSPGALARRLDPVVATAAVQELAGLGGREVLFTGGEPFLHPELAAMVTSAARHVEVTVLTNAMVFDRGSRRTLLERLPRDGVVLQISLDSPDPGLHDAVRGSGSFDRARAGIALARSLGFRVRVAAPLAADLPGRDRVVAGLQALLADDGLPPENLLVRPVAHEGRRPGRSGAAPGGPLSRAHAHRRRRLVAPRLRDQPEHAGRRHAAAAQRRARDHRRDSARHPGGRLPGAHGLPLHLRGPRTSSYRDGAGDRNRSCVSSLGTPMHAGRWRSRSRVRAGHRPVCIRRRPLRGRDVRVLGRRDHSAHRSRGRGTRRARRGGHDS